MVIFLYLLVAGEVEEVGLSSTRLRVYLGVRTCELFLCFVPIVRVRVFYVDFFVFFVLHVRHW